MKLVLRTIRKTKPTKKLRDESKLQGHCNVRCLWLLEIGDEIEQKYFNLLFFTSPISCCYISLLGLQSL